MIIHGGSGNIDISRTLGECEHKLTAVVVQMGDIFGGPVIQLK